MNIICREVGLPFDLESLVARVPELSAVSPEDVARRTAGGGLLLVAEVDEREAGFKLGYPLEGGVFYSWIGGIRPEFRRHGLGRQLLRLQEKLVRERGYHTLRVKSMNKFPAMLRLLIAEGYEIVDLEHRESPDNLKIVFQKQLR